MKKGITFILTAAMVSSLSIPVFANESVKAEPSTAKVSVNGEAIAPQAYTIDGYTYFKLRDLGTALGFAVTWDHAAKMIGIHAKAVEAEAVEGEDAVEYTLEAEKAYTFENETYTKEVVLICPAADTRTDYNAAFAKYEAAFKNCVFEKGMTVISDRDTNVTIDEGCVFAEGPYATAFCVAQYYENGEALVYLEGWGPTYEELAAAEA